MTTVLLAPAPFHVPEADYAARRCEEQERLDAHPALADLSDDGLIALVADPGLAAHHGDPDDAAAVAVILLERRLSGVVPRRPH